MTVFFGRNIDRLYDENIKYQFNPFVNPIYRINESYFKLQDKLNCNPRIKNCVIDNSIIIKEKNGFKIFYRKN